MTAADVRATLAGALDMLATKRAQRLPKKHGNPEPVRKTNVHIEN